MEAEMKKSDSMVRDLTHGPILKNLILFSLPFMAANLLNTLYTLVDLAIVGKYLGSAALSAASNSGQIILMLYSIGIGLGTGGQVLISQLTGAGKREEYQSTIGTLITFGILSAIVTAAIGIGFARPMLGAMNTPAEAFGMAMDYMNICSFGFVFCVGFQTISAILRGMGDSRTPFLISGLCALVNVVLDLLFVSAFRMGTAGAALATVISQLCSFAFAIAYLYPKRERFGFDFKLRSFRINGGKLKIILRLSAPLMISSVCISISLIVVNSFINPFGVVASAVNGVGGKLYSVVQVVTLAMQAATASFVGQNIGARKPDRVRRSVLCALGIGVVFWLVLAAVFLLFPKQVFGLFDDNPEVLELSVKYLRINVWNYFAAATMAPVLGLMSGSGATGLQMGVSILDGVVARIGLSVLFGFAFAMGLQGFWIGSCVASYVSVILGWVYLFSGRWKTKILV